MKKRAYHFLKDVLTEQDGESYEIVRGLATLAMLALVVFTGWSMAMGSPFDTQNFGIGAGTILAAAGAGIGMKAKTEAEK